ncbi:MAG: fluoride efflux transporter CrcB [Chloroflexota bacterium]
MQWQSLLWVGIGGFFGANARYISSTWLNSTSRAMPFGTAFVNITGSLLLAFFLTYISKRANVPDSVSLLIGTGFFGAYTTFSTYANESMRLINDGQWLTGVGYIVGTNLLCLLGVMIGIALAQRF